MQECCARPSLCARTGLCPCPKSLSIRPWFLQQFPFPINVEFVLDLIRVHVLCMGN